MLFNKTAVKVGNAILRGIFPVKIASVTSGTVILNRGAGAGITVGQHYNIYQLGDRVIDPDTKEVLGNTETMVGVIEVTAVEPRFSKAKVIKTTVPLQPGWICRPIATEKKKYKTNYPKATPGW